MVQSLFNFLVSICGGLNEKEEEISQKLLPGIPSSPPKLLSTSGCSITVPSSSPSSVLDCEPGAQSVFSSNRSTPSSCFEDPVDSSSTIAVCSVSCEWSNEYEENEFKIVPVILESKQGRTASRGVISDDASTVPRSRGKARKRSKKKTQHQKISNEVWITHYSNRQKILLVGEGDFSFSASLATAFGSATNMIATSLDSAGFLTTNYKKALENIQKLMNAGCQVWHGVDATKIAWIGVFRHRAFDRVIFNFPHAGFSDPNDSQESQILCVMLLFLHNFPLIKKALVSCLFRFSSKHQKLVSRFLKNAKRLIRDGGEIHISHKTNGFHGRWDLEMLASRAGLQVIGNVRFNLRSYPGYRTKYGYGGDMNFNCNPSQTYKFGI